MERYIFVLCRNTNIDLIVSELRSDSFKYVPTSCKNWKNENLISSKTDFHKIDSMRICFCLKIKECGELNLKIGVLKRPVLAKEKNYG